jgi:hypothetical protein
MSLLHPPRAYIQSCDSSQIYLSGIEIIHQQSPRQAAFFTLYIKGSAETGATPAHTALKEVLPSNYSCGGCAAPAGHHCRLALPGLKIKHGRPAWHPLFRVQGGPCGPSKCFQRAWCRCWWWPRSCLVEVRAPTLELPEAADLVADWAVAGGRRRALDTQP